MHPTIQVNAVGARIPSREDDVHDVVLHLVIHVDAAHHTARRDNIVSGDHRLHSERRFRDRHGVQDHAFLAAVRIINNHLQHEAVDLGLGQRISALLFERVLSGENEKRIGQPIGDIAERDLALLHGFEQRALDLGRRAVDLVGEHEIGEDGPVLGAECAVARIID